MDAGTSNEEQEARERRSAELEFIESAYSPDEAWTKIFAADEEQACQVFRILALPLTKLDQNLSDDDSVVKVELILSMPNDYPVSESEDSVLKVSASLVSAPSNPHFVRKAALNALPKLIDACQAEATSIVGSEAVWSVLNMAEEWIDTKWEEILGEVASSTKQPTRNEGVCKNPSDLKTKTILGRRIIYSHHIIANSKRKALGVLSSQYKLGGCAKIGWPGVIIVEGDEFGCQQFVDEIKSMRWQHLSVRAEEQLEIPEGQSMDSYRKLPMRFEELGEDDMSALAKHCREAGLEHLFLTCMKIYDYRNSTDDDKQQIPVAETEAQLKYTYGAIIHVDHMNDGKGYRRWLRKASLTAGCSLLIKQCRVNGGGGAQNNPMEERKRVDTSRLSQSRPKIIVGLFGDESSVRQVLKRWRTSRVDVDSKNKPCLERMMSVIEEGELSQKFSSTFLKERDIMLSGPLDDENDLDCTFGDLTDILKKIDKKWVLSLNSGVCNEMKDQ